MRDNFSAKTKNILAKRVGYLCSNPSCKKLTCGPNETPDKVVNIGVAAHITAASKGGPRYNANLDSSNRSSLDNGIWLCQNCAKLIDSNSQKYTVSILREWKKEAELFAKEKIGNNYNTEYNWKFNLSNQLTTFSRVNFVVPIIDMAGNTTGEQKDLLELIRETSVVISDIIACSYLETSHLIRRDNFYFALTIKVEKIDDKHYLFGELITHLTPFAYRFGVFADLLRKGDFDGFMSLYDQYPKIGIKRTIALGEFFPYKISRINPAKIEIEFVQKNIITLRGDITTSRLILYFAMGVNGKLVIFEDQNTKEQVEKNFKLIDKTADGFDLSEIWINPDNPEEWDFAKE